LAVTLLMKPLPFNPLLSYRERLLPHADLQEYLSDRFYIPPSLLYSIVRPTKGGTDYEVPVEGDWIVIGVLAEKSEIKYTGAGIANNVAKQFEMRKKMAQERANKAKEAARMEKARKFREARQNGTATASAGSTSFDDKMFDEMAKSDDELRDAFEGSDAEGGGVMGLGQGEKNKKKKKQEEEEEDKEPPARRRYITFKLVDLGEKGAGGGAGILSLKLFESDPDKRRTIKHADSSEEELDTVVNKRTGGKVLVKKKRKELKKSKSNKDIDDEVDGDRFERKEYKGGSGGAFEKFWKETNGTVVAVLNPRIMKPWSVSTTFRTNFPP
jgi:minichromosome maintenance protein 10